MCVVNLAIGGLSVRLQMDICSLKAHILVRPYSRCYVCSMCMGSRCMKNEIWNMHEVRARMKHEMCMRLCTKTLDTPAWKLFPDTFSIAPLAVDIEEVRLQLFSNWVTQIYSIEPESGTIIISTPPFLCRMHQQLNIWFIPTRVMSLSTAFRWVRNQQKTRYMRGQGVRTCTYITLVLSKPPRWSCVSPFIAKDCCWSKVDYIIVT